MKIIKKILGVVAALVLSVCALSVPTKSAKAEATQDVTKNVTVSDWVSQSEWRITYLSLGAGVIPNAIEYGIIDNPSYAYVQDYIAVNGRAVSEINADQSLGALHWTYTIFPSTADMRFQVPVIMFVNNNMVEIKIHSQYVEMLGDSVEVTVKSGLYFDNGGIRYEVQEDKSFTVWEKVVITEEDITDKISLQGWDPAGSALELTYTRLTFGTDILPSGIDYGVLDKTEYMYLQEYILLNGKTLKEINTQTDTSSYVFSTFPSTAAAIYQIPVIVLANNGALELKVHNDYVASLGENLDITVKAGLYLLNGDKKYIVSEDIEYTYMEGTWMDKNKTYAITYFVNGEQYGETTYFPAGAVFFVNDDIQAPEGYVFSGWECDFVTTVVEDMEIHGYIRPIRYQITYHMDGGKNDSTNPICYYVTDGEIVLKDATKEGAIFKGWYSSSDYSQKVEKLEAGTIGNVELYALFEETETKKSGCGSIASLGSAALTLLGVALICKKKQR